MQKESISKRVKSLNDRSTLQSPHDIFLATFHIELYCNEILSRSLDAELDALQDCVIRLERIYF